MRRSKQDAAETRRRIIIAAAAEFRRNGITDTSNSDLMAAAGLTHGGFYRHFESKDQLVAEACDAAVRSMVDTFAAAAAGKSPRSRLKAAAAYLSTKHRDDPAHSCPLAALGSEIARCGEGVRSAATDGFLRLVEIIAAQYDGARPDLAKQRALAAASLMIGAMTMSRIVTDPELSSEILSQANRSFADKAS
jgi:TetR/AcrR family transcriptional repressor of nem operon